MQEKIVIGKQGSFAVLGQSVEHGSASLLHLFGKRIPLLMEKEKAGEGHGQQNEKSYEESQFCLDGKSQSQCPILSTIAATSREIGEIQG
jgi:hypothetical protein